MKVFLVEDEETLFELLQLSLELAGFEVTGAFSGEDGLAGVAAAKPDLISLDVNLPGIDGLEVCRRLKADPATRAIPVIFLSANSQKADVEAGLAVGAVRYLKKPCDADELIGTIRDVLGMPVATSA